MSLNAMRCPVLSVTAPEVQLSTYYLSSLDSQVTESSPGY